MEKWPTFWIGADLIHKGAHAINRDVIEYRIVADNV
ncbi:uncharacterized protein CPUR_06231 [Claviceps purpurea 20.1]|uniref:Uncharacterized protein n=1 Tax=Claviceps purpurea (strain 20.1) TaxID=1111077 RepID=M1W327_CLAP2|nr:uncharacterized protein CPUR_06231 [Claviceps purpurea 20.1]